MLGWGVDAGVEVENRKKYVCECDDKVHQLFPRPWLLFQECEEKRMEVISVFDFSTSANN